MFLTCGRSSTPPLSQTAASSFTMCPPVPARRRADDACRIMPHSPLPPVLGQLPACAARRAEEKQLSLSHSNCKGDKGSWFLLMANSNTWPCHSAEGGHCPSLCRLHLYRERGLLTAIEPCADRISPAPLPLSSCRRQRKGKGRVQGVRGGGVGGLVARPCCHADLG